MGNKSVLGCWDLYKASRGRSHMAESYTSHGAQIPTSDLVYLDSRDKENKIFKKKKKKNPGSDRGKKNTFI
jgi:hypothetical protein